MTDTDYRDRADFRGALVFLALVLATIGGLWLGLEPSEIAATARDVAEVAGELADEVEALEPAAGDTDGETDG